MQWRATIRRLSIQLLGKIVRQSKLLIYPGDRIIRVKSFFGKYQLETMTAASCALVGICPYWSPSLTWGLLIMSGILSLILLGRRVEKDPILARLIAASFLVRVFLTLALFTISAWHLPILESLQRGGGFWQLGGDGIAYHDHAIKILKAWQVGVDLPSVFQVASTEYTLYRDLSLPIAAIYKVLGVSPLHIMIVNAWLGSITVILSYILARGLANVRAARIAAGFVAFWPSFIFWSSQLLKDTVVSMLIVAALALTVSVWKKSFALGGGSYGRTVLHWFALMFVVMGLAYFRYYMGYLLLASVGAAMAIAIGRALFDHRWKPAIVALGLVLSVGTATVVVRSVDFLKLFSTRHPEQGYVKQGLAYQRHGDLDQATAAYQRAIEFNPQYAPAHQGLSSILTDHSSILTDHSSILTDQGKPEDTTPEFASVASSLRVVASNELTEPILDSEKLQQQVAKLVLSSNASWLGRVRQGMIGTGGHSLIDDKINFSSFWDILTYTPRSLALAFLTPFPGQWFFTQGETGIFRLIAAAEVILIYMLIPAILYACWNLFTWKRWEGWFLLLFIAITAIVHGMTVANIGILFRLRLQFLIPLFILIGISGLPDIYQRFFVSLRRRFTALFSSAADTLSRE